MQLPEAPDLRLRELLKLELGQRLTTPKSECPTKQIVRRRVVTVGDCLTSLDGELLETINIQLSRPNAQQITRRGRGQALLAEALAKTRDIDLDVLRRCRRRVTPELLDQPLARDRLVRVQKENRQQSILLTAPDRKLAAVVPRHLQQPNQSKTHVSTTLAPAGQRA